MKHNLLPEMKIYTNPDDIKFLLYEQPEVISDAIKESGRWNIPVITEAVKILKKQPPGLVVDIGAGIGSITVPLATIFNDKMQFISFEPLRLIFMQLATNVLINNLGNVKIENCALSNKEATGISNTLDVHCNANHGSFSFNTKVNEIRGIVQTEEKESYKFNTLDSYNLRDVKLIKLSAPGMELQVLEGAINTIKNNDRPPIFFEIWGESWYESEKNEFFKFLNDNWYTHYTDLGGGHFVAYKTEAQHDFFSSDLEVIETGSFMVSEKVHDVSETLKNQKVYNQ